VKTIELMSLNLKNFQGIKSFNFTPNGVDVDIFGDNGTGKTTVANAFHWLLFGKNSEWQTDFSIKPIGVTGVQTVVEGVLITNDKKISLKKTYYEKWVKRRGQTEKEFSGNTTEYEVDGVPKKKKDYDLIISSL